MFLKSIKCIAASFQYLFYPPFCIYCKKALSNNIHFLCEQCLSELVPLDKKNRCYHCYSESQNEDKSDHLCVSCQINGRVFSSFASVFDYEGPASSIIKKMKYSDMPHLNKGAGAYMTATFLNMHWNHPDYIIPVPISFSHRLQRGYNQSFLLANEISKFIQVPINDCLIRKKGSFGQAGLLQHQREKLSKELFVMRQTKNSLHGKVLLLIDDVYTTGKTLKCCAELLSEDSPKDIYALTFCKTNL